MWGVFKSADLFLITANSKLNTKGSLTMGAGMAKQAKKRFTYLPFTFGDAIQRSCGSLGVYGLLVSSCYPDSRFGLFQTKTDWRSDASLHLIERSTNDLLAWLDEHPGAVVHLNYPGIGYGNLSKTAVRPIIESLPENVTIWER